LFAAGSFPEADPCAAPTGVDRSLSETAVLAKSVFLVASASRVLALVQDRLLPVTFDLPNHLDEVAAVGRAISGPRARIWRTYA